MSEKESEASPESENQANARSEVAEEMTADKKLWAELVESNFASYVDPDDITNEYVRDLDIDMYGLYAKDPEKIMLTKETAPALLRAINYKVEQIDILQDVLIEAYPTPEELSPSIMIRGLPMLDPVAIQPSHLRMRDYIGGAMSAPHPLEEFFKYARLQRYLVHDDVYTGYRTPQEARQKIEWIAQKACKSGEIPCEPCARGDGAQTYVTTMLALCLYFKDNQPSEYARDEKHFQMLLHSALFTNFLKSGILNFPKDSAEPESDAEIRERFPNVTQYHLRNLRGKKFGPISLQAAVAGDLLLSRPCLVGIPGSQILDSMEKRGFPMSQQNLTTNVIKQLKDAGYPIVNMHGYMIHWEDGRESPTDR